MGGSPKIVRNSAIILSEHTRCTTKIPPFLYEAVLIAPYQTDDPYKFTDFTVPQRRVRVCRD